MTERDEQEKLTLEELTKMALTKAHPVLGLTLYIEGSLALHKDAVTRALQAFLVVAEPHLNWYSDDKIGRIRRATPKLLRYPLTWLDGRHTDQEFGWFMWAGAKDVDAPSYLMEGHSEQDSAKDTYLSYLNITFPIERFSGSFPDFAAFVTDFVDTLPVFYGYGGFHINESLQGGERETNMSIVYAMARRFTGLDVGEPHSTAITSRYELKGVNWLTFINQGFVDRLGGFDALRGKLSARVVTRQLPGCLMIQAGPAPGLGDVNAGDRLPLYREVARALKPIRAKDHAQLGYEEEGSFGEEGTIEWLARFDD